MVTSGSNAAFIIFYGFDPKAIDPETVQLGAYQAVVIKRTPDSSAPKYGAVGGFTENNEKPIETARRECNEELVGLIDTTNNPLIPLPPYQANGKDVTIQPFACELTAAQLSKLQEHIGKTNKTSPTFEPGYAERFTLRTDNEVFEVLILPFQTADKLDFYEPHAREDYRIVFNALRNKAIGNSNVHKGDNSLQIVNNSDILTANYTRSATRGDNTMTSDTIITASDLAGAPSIQTINASVRSLRALKIDASQDFKPSPDTVKDSKGADVTSGITDLERDGDGKVVKVGFVNPKDSADKYAKQSFSVADGVLILPGKDEAQVAEINAAVDTVIGKKDTVTLAEFDQVLKTMQAYYTGKGEPADIYNSNTGQLDPAKHIKLGENSYQKVARPENMYVVDVPEGQTVGFQGTVAKDGHMSSAQFSSGSFVVITGTDAKTNEPYARKLDLEYAKQNLRDAKTGKPVDFDAVAKISVDAIMANRMPGTQGQGGSQDVSSAEPRKQVG